MSGDGGGGGVNLVPLVEGREIRVNQLKSSFNLKDWSVSLRIKEYSDRLSKSR